MIKQVISVLFLVNLCSVAHPMAKRKLDTDRGAHRAKRVDTGRNVQLKLFDACRNGYRGTDDERLKDIDKLVQSGADINAKDSQGCTPFHVLLACNKDLSENFVGQFLEKYGHKIDTNFRRKNGYNYLHTAIDKKVAYPAIRKIIQKFPQLVTQVTSKKNLPFVTALLTRSDDTCNEMLKDINVKFLDLQGSTYLHQAVRLGRPEVVKYLVRKNPNMINCKNKKEETPLHWAVGKSSRSDYMVPLVKALITNGADCFIENRGKRTFLDGALRQSQYQEFVNILEQHYKKSLKEICLMNGQNYLDRISSSIFFFNELKPQDIVERIEYLHRKGFTFSAHNFNVAASEYKEPELVIKKLFELGIDINGRDHVDCTVLDALAIKNKHSVLPIVLKLGANPFAANKFNRNCLFVASSSGSYEFIEKVLGSLRSDEERKRLVNAQDTKTERTPLFDALRAHTAMPHKGMPKKSLNTDQVVELWLRLLPYADLTLGAKSRSILNTFSRTMTIFETLETYKDQLPAYDYQRLQKTLELQDQLKKLKNVE